ncbi:MAG: DUF350 domain-containing protein [Oligoflexia bacterium]|nr:DUF350 domain-containing protein [Oligoflexia bacterium]
MIIFPDRPILNAITLTITFSGVGIVMMLLAYRLIDAITPASLSKEIVDNKNLAVAVLVGSLILGTSIIIAAALLG